MSSEKPNFLSQPVVKNIFMFRNGDPYYEARRIVINQKRVSNFETLLREVTGGIQAPFGAVRNIYTPRGGHKVDCLESLQSGEQYVAAGRERFKRLDYQHIGSRRKRMMQTLPMQARPLPPNRIIVSARFLKPIKEPCTIFVVANGDVLNPAMRLLIQQRMLGQFDKILEMITEKMGLKVLGGVRSLYTYEGHQVTDGNQLEGGQLYVAVGRERFKKLPYSDLLFTKPRGTRRVSGMKAYSLPPIYRFSKQNGNSKSIVRSSDSGDGDSKASPPGYNGNNSKEHLSSIVREISQARLISLRKKRSGQSMTLGVSDNDDPESKADDTKPKTPQDQLAEELAPNLLLFHLTPLPSLPELAVSPLSRSHSPGWSRCKSPGLRQGPGRGPWEALMLAVQKPADDDAKATEENDEREAQKEESAAAENASNDEKMGNQETNGEKEGGEEKKKEVEAEVKEEVTDESKEQVKSEEQASSSSNSDKTRDSQEKKDGGHTSSEGEKDEQDKDIEEEKQDKDSAKGEKSSEDQVNDVDTGEEQKETENSNDPGKTQSDNETKENNSSRSNSSNSNQEEDVSKTKEGATKESGEEERKVNGKVSGEDEEVESEAELDMEEEHSASRKDATANGEKGEENDKDNQDKSGKGKK
ncbi:doublecortin domain-containing protein 2-like isoform X1 [Dicentrarchus labrax]|uniref:Doublecortin domain-containing protein 2 n=1 Tax=Dicentrarchus labrax TaxID=13489 RepID=A0A8P4KCN6_DICLA|nr:doublecortin domain-containing protein 2-like isoform X1 [Dicentrarchus labrax]